MLTWLREVVLGLFQVASTNALHHPVNTHLHFLAFCRLILPSEPSSNCLEVIEVTNMCVSVASNYYISWAPDSCAMAMLHAFDPALEIAAANGKCSGSSAVSVSQLVVSDSNPPGDTLLCNSTLKP